MEIIENLEEIKNIEQEVYVFILEPKTLDKLTSLGYQYEMCGIYKIESYTFSIYKIIK